MSTNNVLNFHQPPAHVQQRPVTRAHIDALKAQVAQAWGKTKVNRLETGKLLVQLNQDLAKPGHGKFKDALEELGIPRTTAFEYMRLYRASQGSSQSSVRNRTDHLSLQKLCLKTLKKLANTSAFDEELAGQLTAIANSVAYRYGHIAKYNPITLAKQPPLPTEQKPVPTFKK